MRIMIASDIHGAQVALDQLLVAFEREGAEELILLGDLYYHGPRNALPSGYSPMDCAERLNAISDQILAVKGNCDAEIDETISHFPLLESATVMVNGKKVYLAHGHRINPDVLPSEPCDVLFYGHTHLFGVLQKGKILAVNPGSIGAPKGGNPPSFALMNEDGILIKSLDGDTLVEHRF